MKTRLFWAVAVAVVLAIPAMSQEREAPHGEAQHAAKPEHTAPRGNQGHIPAPPASRPATAKPESDIREGGRVNNTPHVANNHWFGHDAPNDPRHHLDHPFEHGHFAHIGPSFRYNVVRIDLNLHRFWLPGGFFFDVSPVDWALAADWCWTCGQDFVVYDDPDHPGWYMLYNVHTGGYVHVMYMGT